jgi:putative cardiolipin synthase
MSRTLLVFLAAMAALVAGCATLPPPQDRTASTAMTDTADTRLGRAVTPIVATKESLKVKGRFGAGKVAGLHAKTYAVDSVRIFVGPFNFDQRSARLNTEMGLVIDSPALAGMLTDFFDTSVPGLAYEVRLAPDGESLVWIERPAAGEVTRYDVDPETDAAKRFRVEFLSILPIEWLL